MVIIKTVVVFLDALCAIVQLHATISDGVGKDINSRFSYLLIAMLFMANVFLIFKG